MDDKKLILTVTAATLFILIVGLFLISKFIGGPQVGLDKKAKVSVPQTSYDWGKIGINNGNAEKVFSIVNKGESPLKLFNVVTSCACTTAQLSYKGTVSPLYGMHTKYNFILEVPPGQTASLKVIFDPAYHGPNGIGPITRQVKVETNDLENPEISFFLTATVVR